MLVSMMRRQAFSSDPATGSPPPTPALFTSTSSPVPRSLSAAIADCTESASHTSIARTIGSAPRARISPAVLSNCERVREAMATIAPGAENASATARPMPRPPPVTRMEGTAALFRAHVVAAPVPSKLVEKRQRLKVLHPVEEQNSIEMISFMLDHARGETGSRHFDLLARAIEGANDDVSRTRHPA